MKKETTWEKLVFLIEETVSMVALLAAVAGLTAVALLIASRAAS